VADNYLAISITILSENGLFFVLIAVIGIRTASYLAFFHFRNTGLSDLLML
jgi:hypothetical protein